MQLQITSLSTCKVIFGMFKEFLDCINESRSCHEVWNSTSYIHLKKILNVKPVISWSQSSSKEMRFRPCMALSLWQQVVMLFLHLCTPKNCGSIFELLHTSNDKLLSWRNKALLRLSVANSNTSSYSILFFISKNCIHRFKIINWEYFLVSSNLIIPLLPFIQVHNEVREAFSDKISLDVRSKA